MIGEGGDSSSGLGSGCGGDGDGGEASAQAIATIPGGCFPTTAEWWAIVPAPGNPVFGRNAGGDRPSVTCMSEKRTQSPQLS
eukprot:4543291-Prymnesium_polylepis.2